MTAGKAEAEARVDALLIEPLEGLSRKRGMSAEKHAKMLERLRARLGYMTDANLRGMVDLILRHAVKGAWPDGALIEACRSICRCRRHAIRNGPIPRP